jgi:hypothetical protein
MVTHTTGTAGDTAVTLVVIAADANCSSTICSIPIYIPRDRTTTVLLTPTTLARVGLLASSLPTAVCVLVVLLLLLLIVVVIIS